MEEKLEEKPKYRTVISLKLHNILSENGIEAEKTDINNNDPTKTVWKYLPSAKFYELRDAYIKASRDSKK